MSVDVIAVSTFFASSSYVFTVMTVMNQFAHLNLGMKAFLSAKGATACAAFAFSSYHTLYIKN